VHLPGDRRYRVKIIFRGLKIYYHAGITQNQATGSFTAK
jgi:hypothetical protein